MDHAAVAVVSRAAIVHLGGMHFLTILILLSAGAAQAAEESDWPTYGRDPGGTRYSPLKQINRENVTALRVAWTYHTHALEPHGELDKKAAFEATPILFEGNLYLSTPFDQVIALDPATGAEKWKYDPDVSRSANYSEVTSRGVAAWVDSSATADAACRARIFIGTIDARLIALDARTGRPCGDFGEHGAVDLTQGVELRDRGDYQVTSPPAIAAGLVITGSSIGDNRAVDVERGVVRAFNARTGKLRWTWDPIPWAEKQKTRTGAANAWSIFSVDASRGLVFIPTGSASPDFYGGGRPGNNAHANSVVALRVATAELVWSFQVVHHDLWDYDIASQPSLLDFHGRPAVAVTTKMGYVFVLDRETGKPLHEVRELPTPPSDVPGELASPTQPVPSFQPLVPQKIGPADAWGLTEEEREKCRAWIASLRTEGIFTPPSLQGTLSTPGNVGGVNWGGAAIDPEHNLLIANTNRLPFVVRLILREKLAGQFEEARRNRLEGEFGRQQKAPYAMYREPLLGGPHRVPCINPPWGALVALDLKTGKLRWETPLGSMAPGLPPGSLNLGGPIATAGGLVFTAAAMDNFLRAFNSQTGREIWKGELPTSAQATPMTFAVGGKQYVVICAGGHGKLGTKLGDAVVAFALGE
jgi:quinoprotein glucose dehydrogenase